MEPKVILDTAVAEAIWTGGQGAQWIRPVASGDLPAALNASSFAELVSRAPDRRAEIQLAALASLLNIVELDLDIAQKAGQIARDLDPDDPTVMSSAIVAATALQLKIPVACIDEEFFSAMGCEIAEPA